MTFLVIVVNLLVYILYIYNERISSLKFGHNYKGQINLEGVDAILPSCFSSLCKHPLKKFYLNNVCHDLRQSNGLKDDRN